MAAMPGSAGLVTLLPSDQSYPSASRIEGNTSARQRRRKTTRNPDSKKSTRGNLTENGLELVSLESSGSRSPRDWPRTGVSRGRGNPEESRGVDSPAVPLGSSGLQDVSVATSSTLNSSARQRRVTRRERTRHSPPRPHPEPELEDSTDGVARILKRRLQLLELDESKQSTVISNKDHADLGSGGMVTESEDEVPREGLELVMDTAENTGRPLPPPANGGDGEDEQDGSHDPNATPPSTDILGITIHGTDELQASVLLSHPSIRISVVNATNGELLKKSVPEKCVMSYYERGNPSVDYILPILTQPFECRRHRALKGTLKAQWEETLTFNEQLSYFTLNEDVVIFFELLDFVSGKGYTSRVLSEHKPWHRIAWAFLCPAGKACASKLGSKIRLQLYKYPRSIFGHSTESGEVYNLWCGHYRSTYPSTLYVTVSGISTDLPQEDSTANKRSLFPFQEEKGSISFEQMVKLQLASKSLVLTALPTSTLASGSLRLPGQPCQIPTSLLSTQYPTPMGCSSVAFSHSGHLLAAGCADQSTLYPLVIYEIPSFKPVMVTEGHRGIIYQVCWSQDDKLLASVSADGIVKLWCLNGSSLKPLATLPHPCYVYSACFITGAEWEGSNVLATGAYDGYIRIWSMSDDDTSIHMVGEFRGHYGQVNCLAWSKKTAILYAGDSKGVLGAWHKKRGMWMLKHKTDVMNGQSFTTINLHPNDRKLLLHTRKAKLAMLDLRIDHICCEYSGIQPAGLERCASLLSPCGRMVFAGTTSGTVHVWSADTGKELHVYSGLPFTSAVGAMAFHPSEHLLALSSFGECQPLMALNHLIGSQPVASQRGGERGVAPLIMTPRPHENKEGGGAGRVELLGSQLEGSRRWKDLVKTLDKVTARAKS